MRLRMNIVPPRMRDHGEKVALYGWLAREAKP